MKRVSMALALSVILSIVAPAHAHGPADGMGPGMMGWGYGMGWVWSILMFVFWIAVLVGVVFLIRWLILSTGRRGAPPEDSAAEILKKRYARGEINKEEFERMKKDIA